MLKWTLANRGSPGKWPLKQREREREREIDDVAVYYDGNLCVDAAPNQPVDTRVSLFMKYQSLPSDLTVTVLATYYTNAGQSGVSSLRNILLSDNSSGDALLPQDPEDKNNWMAPWKNHTYRYISFCAHHSMVFYFWCSVHWWKGSVRFQCFKILFVKY